MEAHPFFEAIYEYIRQWLPQNAIIAHTVALSHTAIARRLLLPEQKIALLLLPIPPENPHWTAQSFLAATAYQGRQIYIWEDLWLEKPQAVYSRLLSLLGQTVRVHARATRAARIDKPTLHDFLTQHHTSVCLTAKYKYGLWLGTRLVAVAAFGPLLAMRKDEGVWHSGELIRFGSESGVTVVGGLDKLLKAFSKEKSPHDIMTYADKDWSDGNSYRTLGFECRQEMPPQAFWIHPQEKQRHYQHRLAAALLPSSLSENEVESALMERGYFRIFNTGNFKFVRVRK